LARLAEVRLVVDAPVLVQLSVEVFMFVIVPPEFRSSCSVIVPVFVWQYTCVIGSDPPVSLMKKLIRV